VLVILHVGKTNNNRELREAKPAEGVTRFRGELASPRGKKASWPLGFLGYSFNAIVSKIPNPAFRRGGVGYF
jgi:hypothetical protein